ncbi:hypothetical protein [Bacillus sp. AG4(2022)]|uniref:hypothetical protein n=1 Tax=Bacillus sp. AG4(2022) TaxID=2962594 RepID=UPI002881446E|nr:hypothetical protein [Bacillus sp. AG4(2022)]MDT0160399.1 hypothetical protein [Bacillus sp. AG4(2022)]
MNKLERLKDYLQKENSELLGNFKWGMEGSNDFSNFMKLVRSVIDEQEIELTHKDKLEVAIDELRYALTTGSDDNREHYINNAIRFIEEAMVLLDNKEKNNG